MSSAEVGSGVGGSGGDPDWEKDGGVDTPVNCVPSVSVIQTSPGEYGKDTNRQTDRQT